MSPMGLSLGIRYSFSKRAGGPWLAFVLTMLLGGRGFAQQDDTPRASQELLNKLGTPRLTVETFLEGTPEDQVLCLDLSRLMGEARSAKARELAYMLRLNLPKFVRIELDRIPNDPDHPTPYSFSDQADKIDPWLMGDSHGQAVSGRADRCSTCHVQERCISCHVSPGLDEIAAFPFAPEDMVLPDMEAWERQTQHKLLAKEEKGDETFRFLIEKTH